MKNNELPPPNCGTTPRVTSSRGPENSPRKKRQ
jgi:hypothetical protein